MTPTITDHLLELRHRLLKALSAVALFVVALLPFANPIYDKFAAPLTSLLPSGSSMIAMDVTSPFFTPFKLCLFLGLFLALPAVLYQIWAFIAPALYKHEKRLFAPLLFGSIFLFYLGVAFAYFVVLPLAFTFFVHSAPSSVKVMTDISAYSDFVFSIFFAFGLAFQLPIITFITIHTNLIQAQTLKQNRPYVIIAAFTIGMLLTPPDVISQSLLAIPMCLLFELGLWTARFITPKEETHADHKS